MKYILILTLLFTSLFADLKSTIYGLYSNKQYTQVCRIGISGINKYKDDEDYLSLYAFSCLYSDNIDQLAVPITLLYRTKESRTNAAYLSTILMQKKLLLNSLVDNIPISHINLPSTEYILSKVFDLYSENMGKSTTLQSKTNSHINYTLSIIKTDSKNIIVIEEYYDKILTSRHTYQ